MQRQEWQGLNGCPLGVSHVMCLSCMFDCSVLTVGDVQIEG